MVKHLLRIILGTAHFRIDCENSESILNTLIKSNQKVLNIERGDGQINFDCYLHKTKKITALLSKKYNYTISYNGLPPVIYKYRHRAGIPIGCLLFILLFYYTSLFVWDIEVKGCETLSVQSVLTQMNQIGLKTGRLKSKLDIKTIENSFLMQNKDVSWVSVNLKGTVAFVELRENTRKVEKLNTSVPCSIYASRDGVIASVKAYMGYSVVNTGDTVTAGDLIVTGDYVDKYGVEYKLHSMASVMAYTQHHKSIKIPYKSKIQIPTGKSKSYYKFKIIRFSLPLYFNKNILYNNYSVNKSVKKFKLFNNIVLPFWLEKTTYTQTEEVVLQKSKDAAVLDAYEYLDNYQNDLVGIVINNKQYTVTQADDGVTVSAVFDCYEDIGIQIKI